MPKRQRKFTVPARYRRRQAALAKRLAAIDFIWPGTIQRRTQRCGKANCACQTDPAARHGPYISWTTKRAGKTVAKKLSVEEADLLEQWVRNRQKMQEIIKRMNALAKQALKAISIDHWAEESDV
jgi:hypothetical protein